VSTVEQVAGWVDEARSVVVLTGAGISTDSGISDFRGPNGVWTKDPKAERMAHISVYMDDPDVRKRSWRNRIEHPAWHAQPNSGHAAIVELERRGKLHTLITQNVDGLHQAAGSDPELVVEMHGTVHEVMCMACDERAPMERALARVRAGEEDPPCRSCGGILKSATVSFGQNLDPHDIERAERAALECDLMLCVGSTLTVYPVAEIPYVASASGARVVVINAEPTAFDQQADAVLRGQIADILPKVVAGD
jgi:NAD-dependent deacetylase